MPGPPFSFDAYREAVEAGGLEPWLAFYADDAEWIELRAASRPSTPNVMRGRSAIRAFLTSILGGGPLEIRLSYEVVGPARVAYRATVSLGGGRRIVEPVILELRDTRIATQVEVEARD